MQQKTNSSSKKSTDPQSVQDYPKQKSKYIIKKQNEKPQQNKQNNRKNKYNLKEKMTKNQSKQNIPSKFYTINCKQNEEEEEQKQICPYEAKKVELCKFGKNCKFSHSFSKYSLESDMQIMDEQYLILKNLEITKNTEKSKMILPHPLYIFCNPNSFTDYRDLSQIRKQDYSLQIHKLKELEVSFSQENQTENLFLLQNFISFMGDLEYFKLKLQKMQKLEESQENNIEQFLQFVFKQKPQIEQLMLENLQVQENLNSLNHFKQILIEILKLKQLSGFSLKAYIADQYSQILFKQISGFLGMYQGVGLDMKFIVEQVYPDPEIFQFFLKNPNLVSINIQITSCQKRIESEETSKKWKKFDLKLISESKSKYSQISIVCDRQSLKYQSQIFKNQQFLNMIFQQKFLYKFNFFDQRFQYNEFLSRNKQRSAEKIRKFVPEVFFFLRKNLYYFLYLARANLRYLWRKDVIWELFIDFLDFHQLKIIKSMSCRDILIYEKQKYINHNNNITK